MQATAQSRPMRRAFPMAVSFARGTERLASWIQVTRSFSKAPETTWSASGAAGPGTWRGLGLCVAAGISRAWHPQSHWRRGPARMTSAALASWPVPKPHSRE